MVKDEKDVLWFTLNHLIGAGVDELIVADNGSTDGTREMLEVMSANLPILVVDDPEVGYYQSRKMTALAELARQRGAEWIIPFDADECWFAKKGTLKEAIERARTHPILGCALHNYFPTSRDNQDEANPFLRIRYRGRHAGALPKVIVKALPGMVIHQGNHGATIEDNTGYFACGVRVGHFPWRSFEQFVTKIRNGAAAYAATDLPEDVGAHWRGYGRVLQEGGEEALRTDVWEQWFFDPPEKPILDPVPFQG